MESNQSGLLVDRLNIKAPMACLLSHIGPWIRPPCRFFVLKCVLNAKFSCTHLNYGCLRIVLHATVWVSDGINPPPWACVKAYYSLWSCSPAGYQVTSKALSLVNDDSVCLCILNPSKLFIHPDTSSGIEPSLCCLTKILIGWLFMIYMDPLGKWGVAFCYWVKLSVSLDNYPS